MGASSKRIKVQYTDNEGVREAKEHSIQPKLRCGASSKRPIPNF